MTRLFIQVHHVHSFQAQISSDYRFMRVVEEEVTSFFFFYSFQRFVFLLLKQEEQE